METTKVITVINGKGGVGKDTLCDFVAKRYKTMNISAITRVKEIAEIAGWDGEKDEKGRKLLSDLKKALVEYGDLPTKYLLENVDEFLHSDDEVLFVHIREIEEIKKFVSMTESVCSVYTLLVTRDTGVDSWGNASDDDVENYNYDFIYHNDLPLNKAETDFVSFFAAHIGIHLNERIIGVDIGEGPDHEAITMMKLNADGSGFIREYEE